MTADRPFPLRPRLADHVVLRRRLYGDQELYFARDEISGDVLDLELDAVQILLCADGTRDFGGLLLEATRRGIFRRSSTIQRVLAELHQLGLLADGIEAGPARREPTSDRPLELLPRFKLSCDANGTCCSSHDAIAFTSPEAARARAFAPQAIERLNDTEREAPSFLPLISSIAPAKQGVLTAALVDDACPFLAEDGRCHIQIAGGARAKPKGCSIFPATFVDDGTAIRVSVVFECPCVPKSLGRDDGDPLVPVGATMESDLIPGSPIIRLSERLPIATDHESTRLELRVWARAVTDTLDAVDNPVAALWRLADAVSASGLDPQASVAALEDASPPDANEFGIRLMRLSSRARSLADDALELGAGATPLGKLVRWIADAAAQLVNNTVCDAAASTPGRGLDQERFFISSALFGHLFVTVNDTLEATLRDRALRLVLARQMERTEKQNRPDHPASEFPLVAVEAVMRGRGLERY